MAMRKSKRHKSEVIKFELNMGSNLARIQEMLERREYTVSGYYNFTVHEPKKRMVYAAYYKDRVVNHCLCINILRPIIEKRLIYDNAACQINKGTHFALGRLTKFMSEHHKAHGAKGYFLKCDISKYFASIDHDVLKSKLVRVVKDEEVLRMLFMIIDSYHTEGTPGKGIPLGNQTSQWFALYYLDALDRLIKEKLRIKHYIRYMDDLILVHESKEHLQEVLNTIRAFAADELTLTLNEKTQIFPIKNGVDFVGFHIYLSDSGKVIRKLKTATKKRFKKRLIKLKIGYAHGRIDLDKVQNVLASYRGHIKHGHTYRLVDKALNEFVLVRKR